MSSKLVLLGILDSAMAEPGKAWEHMVEMVKYSKTWYNWVKHGETW